MNRSATPDPRSASASLPPRADFLTAILRRKRAEVEALRGRAADLRSAAADAPPPRAWAAALRVPGRVALIAEIKRRAPSAGELDPNLDARERARLYERAGAAALSVLTDRDFDGEIGDVTRAREAVALPTLRKDFVLDPVQIWEARAAGADAVLLIMGALEDGRLRDLLGLAGELGMGTLVEAHDAEDLGRAVAADAPVVGVNNRDLRSFATSLEVTRRLAASVPPDRILVAESGIESAAEVQELGALGVDAVLVGRALITHRDAARLAAELAGQPRRARS